MAGEDDQSMPDAPPGGGEEKAEAEAGQEYGGEEVYKSGEQRVRLVS